MRYSFLAPLLGLTATSLAQLPDEAAFFPGPSTVSAQSPPILTTDSPLAPRSAATVYQSGVRLTADVANLNLNTWSEDTTRSCAQKINGTKSNNPSGLSICYNVPLLITESGVFAADLRLFQVASPTGDWADVPNAGYSMNLVYQGAAVASRPRNLTIGEIDASDQGMAGFNTTLSHKADYQFIGGLDADVITQSPSDAILQSTLTPQIYLMGMTTSGKMLNISVPSAASFIAGVFSNSTGANATELADAAKATPFVLPGTKISIVPTGLYFFSAYFGLSLAIVGWGTLERAKFRDQYRKRVAAQGFR